MRSKTLQNGRHSYGVSVNSTDNLVLLQLTNDDSQTRIAMTVSEVAYLVNWLNVSKERIKNSEKSISKDEIE